MLYVTSTEVVPTLSHFAVSWGYLITWSVDVLICNASSLQVNGKGSLWCVDPEYKPNLVQALKKQPFPSALAFYTPPASPPR